MALDVGDVRIGVALSDSLLITAQGYKTIDRTNIRRDTTEILEIMKDHDVNTIVIGLPLSLSGEDSAQTEKVRQFKTKLENKLKSSGVKGYQFVYSDERFSTVIAESVLIDANVSRMDRKRVIDKMAASVILQSYLDKLKANKDKE